MNRKGISEYYDNLSRTYMELYGAESLRRYAAAACKVPRGSRVLDLGCGIGLGAGYFLGNFSYIGLDISLGMLRLAKAWDADLICGDGGMLPLRDSSFDVVVMINVVDVESGDEVVGEAMRVGARLLAISPRDVDNSYLSSKGANLL